MNYIVALFLFCTTLHAVEERDWVNDWFTPEFERKRELPGTEQLLCIDGLEGFAVSVTYALDGGRFGDQLTNYAKALWISWKYDLPFIYHPFDYSDQLALSDIHTVTLNEKVIQSFVAKHGFYHFLDSEKAEKAFAYLDSMQHHQQQQRAIWNIGLLTPLLEEHFCDKLDDEEFRAFLQKLIKPKAELNLIKPPSDCKTIALHVRTGVGYDLEVNVRNMPTKFPPDTFYVAALKEAAGYFKDHPLYVYIFTDHPEPTLIEDRLRRAFAKEGMRAAIVLDCRRVNNAHDHNVLEDLFSMTQFDCIIHPDSSLSRFAAILSAPILEIAPSNWAECRRDEQGNLILDKQGNVIVDPLVIERSRKGKEILRMAVFPIEPSILF